MSYYFAPLIPVVYHGTNLTVSSGVVDIKYRQIGKRVRSKVWFSLLFLLIPLSAQARARDSVMASAYRCARIADSRQWLDCYYGAAQLVRAQLALPPALAHQIRLATAPPDGGVIADTDLRDRVMADVSHCYILPDDRQWLDCYYGAAQPVRGRLGLPPWPQTTAAQLGSARDRENAPLQPKSTGPASAIFKGSEVDSLPAQRFGLSAAAPRFAPKVDRIVSRMESYSLDRLRIFTVTLDNGQVWHQLSGDTDYAHWKKPAGSYTALITRGALGSFNFAVKGSPGTYKVERVK